MKPKQRNKPEFRICAKKLMLTYSQVPEEMSPDEVIAQLNKKIYFTQHGVGIEYHQDGDQHFHALLLSEKKIDICSVSMFDVEFEGKTYKCHVEGVRNLSAAIRYVCKKGAYITDIKNLYHGRLLTKNDLLRKISDTEGVDAALDFYEKNYPKEAMGRLSLLNVERFLRRRVELRRRSVWSTTESMSTTFKVEDFKELAKIKKWVDSDYRRTLILVGPAGCEKTQFVKALSS